jgi:hypothetical protein
VKTKDLSIWLTLAASDFRNATFNEVETIAWVCWFATALRFQSGYPPVGIAVSSGSA